MGNKHSRDYKLSSEKNINTVKLAIEERQKQEKKMDTVTLAIEERQKQGSWEAEISFGGEGDLAHLRKTCDKNHGHKKFVPVDQFNVNHLPSGYCDQNLVDLVQALSNLVVRVSVKHVSDGRPETFPGSDKPYPRYRDCQKRMRLGTGWVTGVDKYTFTNNSSKTCECLECRNSSQPKSQFAHIRIHTAKHVVFDDLEAAYTTCHLFYDSGKTPDSCHGVVTLVGMSDVFSDIDQDWCQMKYVTHDLELADRLDKMVTHIESLVKVAAEKYYPMISDIQSSLPQTETVHDRENRLTVIVSHPHGCSKQVSVGEYILKSGMDNYWVCYTYTTSTCPGSSGAPVFVIGQGLKGWWASHGHSGNCRENNDLNYSCFGNDIPINS